MRPLILAVFTSSFLLAQPALPQRPAISIEGPETIRLNVGESVPLVQAIRSIGPGNLAFTLDQDTPGRPGGIAVTPPLLPFVSLGDTPQIFTQTIQAFRAGTYLLRTTVRRVGPGGGTEQRHIRIDVDESSLRLNRLIAWPAAVRAGAAEPVRFSVSAEGRDLPPSVTVEAVGAQRFTLTLFDDGQGDDLEARDGVYTGVAQISTVGQPVDTCVTYRAFIGTERSKPARVCASSLPVTGEPSGDAVFESNGMKVAQNEIGVVFQQGIREAAKIAVAAAVGGTIVASMPEADTYLIRLSPPPRDFAELNRRVQLLRAQTSIVREADFNALTSGEAGITPNDVLFPQLWWAEDTRAKEAWLVSRGKGQVVGVVDTGVAYNHADLSPRVVKGYDYVDNDGDPQDFHGHGTHVAGIAAGTGNNGIGIAGMAWEAKVFAPRVLNSKKDGYNWNVAHGIRQAIAYGAKVVNYSGSGDSKAYVCAAAQDTVDAGVLFIAAAGNQGNSTERYPGACGGVIAVGNYMSNQQRNSTSNFGSWVDIAAPGTTILSTVPVATCSLCTDSGYNTTGGTSMSSPMVAGTAALVRGRYPGISRGELWDRIRTTSVPFVTDQPIGNKLDTFEAVFNGSFESGDLDWWSKVGDVWSSGGISAPIIATHRKRFAALSVDPNKPGASVARLSQNFGYPQDQTKITMEAAVFIAAPTPASPATPSPVLTAKVTRDGSLVKAYSFSTAALGSNAGLSGWSWSGWQIISFEIPAGLNVAVTFELSTNGTNRRAYAGVDRVRFP